jgi:hypothetical protein
MIATLFKDLFCATTALVSNSPAFFRRHPKTPLRVLCITALDYLGRKNGHCLSSGRRTALAYALDTGAAINDHFDENDLSVASYRAIRKKLMRALTDDFVWSDYYRNIRLAEYQRPLLPCPYESAVRYRESVVEISLEFMLTVAGLPIDSTKSPTPLLRVLFPAVMLAQLIDDVMDWRHDLRWSLPSFVTAGSTTAPLTSDFVRAVDQGCLYLVQARSDPSQPALNFCATILHCILRLCSCFQRLLIFGAKRDRSYYLSIRESDNT